MDLRDHLIFPGLINAHDHLQLNAIPRLAHDAAVREQLRVDRRVRSAPAAATDVAAAVAVAKDTRFLHGALKNLLAGATTVAHHDPWDDVFDRCRTSLSTVVRRYGWAHSLGLGTVARRWRRRDTARRSARALRRRRRAQPWIIHLAEGMDDVARAPSSRALDAMGCLGREHVSFTGSA